MEFDDQLAETALRRGEFLRFMADKPRTRHDIQEALDISKATCHRIVRGFEDDALLARVDDGYELTGFGRAVAAEVDDYETALRLGQKLRPLLEAFDATPFEFDVDLFADASVTRSHPDDPARPIHEYLKLYENTAVIRTLARTSFVPRLYLEELFEQFFEVDDKRGVVIYPKSAVEDRYTEYRDAHRRVAEEDLPLRYRVYDRSPFGMTIYDRDHVALRGYDAETNVLQLVAHTDDQDAVAWAEEVFDRYYDRSRPLSAFDTFPDWVPDSEIYEDLF